MAQATNNASNTNTKAKALKDLTLKSIEWRKFTKEDLTDKDGKVLVAKGTEIHEVSKPEEYRKAGIQVMLLPAKRKDAPTPYVLQSDYDKVSVTRTSKTAKVTSELKGKDLTKMTAEELKQLQAKLALVLG